MSKFNVIWKEVYRRNIKSASFIMMIISPIITFGMIALIGLFLTKEAQNSQQANISIVSNDIVLKQKVESAPLTYHFEAVNNESEAIQKLSNQTISGYVVLSRIQDNRIKADFYTTATSNAVTLKPLKELLQSISVNELAASQGITPTQLQQLSSVTVETTEKKLDVQSLKNGVTKELNNNDSKENLRRGVAYIVVVLMFIFVMNYASVIGQEIATEKGTRMMEVVLSSTSANTHFYGKFVGIMLVLLTQIMTYIILAIPCYFIFDDIKKTVAQLFPNIDLLGTITDMIITSIIYTILGILLYVTISAMLGSIVSRVEDVQKVMSPIVFIGMGGYFIGMFALSMPNSAIVRFGSLFPLFTPFVMPFRLAAGTVEMSELILATIFTIITSLVILYISVKMYKTNVLVYSDKGIFNVLKQSLALQKEYKQK